MVTCAFPVLITQTHPLNARQLAGNQIYFVMDIHQGWDRFIILFFVVSMYGAVVWICDENSADNTPMFSLLMNSACTASRHFWFLMLPLSEAARTWDYPRSCKETQPGHLAPVDQS